ncbi:hypothetical protein [Gimesia aquarii]|uniref:Uncharacterized protein n=1 Tax=Gimesia aquarii TaxID=2527964 RepID=A0A517WWH6_9PLAN|nr:hypothetical protein [Gimesia aquarii]QDU09627.1 hypothetical protein V202x_30030 [Gimesia aquarii]
MTQTQLEQQVAGATGEDLREVQSRGFSLADPTIVNFDPEPCNLPPQILDWDQVDLERNVALINQPVL